MKISSRIPHDEDCRASIGNRALWSPAGIFLRKDPGASEACPQVGNLSVRRSSLTAWLAMPPRLRNHRSVLIKRKRISMRHHPSREDADDFHIRGNDLTKGTMIAHVARPIL